MTIEDKAGKQQEVFYLLGLGAVLLISLLLGLLLVGLLRQQRELRRLSQLDPLTGLYNYKKTYELAQAAFLDCQSSKCAFTVAIAEIDQFKQVNDNYGHDTGDEVLKTLTVYMKQYFTGDCIVGRTGGREFSLFLPGKTAEQATALIEEYQLALRPVTIYGNMISISLSFGLAMAKPEQKLLDTIIRNADNALHETRHNVRNQIVHYKGPDPLVWDILPQMENA